MKNLIYLIIISAVLSCNKSQEKIKGDLFFKLVSISSPSGMSEEEISKIEIILDSVEKNKTSNDGNELLNHFKILKKHNLLGSPYLQLKEGNDVKTIFIPQKEYEKISSYSLSNLQQKNRKVEIELEITELEKDIYSSNKIISIKEVDGETPWKK